VNSGTPARLYVNSDYSIQVQNRNGSVVYSAPAATERFSDVVVNGIDSSEVSFLQAGTGAVTRTAQAKMRDIVSVKDFGVVGDGVTDDTVAIQAAIAAAANKTLFVPSGMVIYVTSQITLANPIAITMESGSRFKSGYTSMSPDNGLINVTASDVTLTNVTIDAQSRDHVGIKATSVNRLKINGGYIYDFGERSGIWMQSCNFCDITNVRIGPNIVSTGANNLGAVYANQCTEILIRELRVAGFYGKGVSLRLSERGSVTDCFINGNPTDFGDGIYLGYDCAYITISGCHVRNCGGNGIKLSRGTQRSSIVGCTIDGLTVAGNGIMLQGAVECTVTACKVALTDATSATRALLVQPHNEDAPGEGSDCSDNVIAENTFVCFSSTVPAVQMDDNATGFTTYRNKILNNYVYGGQIGMAIYTLQSFVSGNTVRDPSNAGISVRYAASFSSIVDNSIFSNAALDAIYIDLSVGGQGVSVRGNTLRNCAYGGIYAANIVRSNIAENTIVGTGTGGSGITVASTTNDLNIIGNYVHNFPNYGVFVASSTATGINIEGNQFENCIIGALDISANTGRVIGNIAKTSGAFVIANKAALIHYGNVDKRLYVTTPSGAAQYAIAVDNAGAVTSTLV
jgi:hypothetical protein